jgi:RNase P subunit RPR2
MRRTEKEIGKLRLRIIELRQKGKTYEEIRRITSASPTTIAKILKNFKGRYCIKCGEVNTEVLEEHHPDKVNMPDYTITLCANCHEKITREQLRKRNKQQESPVGKPANNISVEGSEKNEKNQMIPVKTSQFNQPIVPVYHTNTEISPSATIDALYLLCGLAGLVKALDQSTEKKDRLLFLLISGFNFFGLYKNWKNSAKK